MENIRIISVTDIGELSSNDMEAWTNFLQTVNDPRVVFQIPELYFQSVNIEKRVTSLFACLVFRAEHLIGLFTFKIQNVQKSLKFGHFSLGSFNFNEIRSIGSGLLLECSDSEKIMIETEIISAIKHQSSKHNAYVFLEAIERQDLLYSPTNNNTDFTYYDLDCSYTFHLHFKENFDAFMKNKSKKKRHSINKDLRRFEKLFDDQFYIKHSQNGLTGKEFIESASEVLNNSWKKGLVGSIVGSEGFLQQLTILLEKNVARIFVLEIENKPVAFAIGYSYQNNFFYEEIAYDETFAQSGIGSYLTISVVKLLHNEFKREGNQPVFSFGVGDNIYKRKLCDEYIDCKNLMLCSPRTKSSLFFTMKGVLDYMYKFVREVAIKWGIHSRLRAKLKQRNQ